MVRAYKILCLVIIPEIIATYDPQRIGYTRTTEYCNVETCANPSAHTMCRNSPNELGLRCQDFYMVSGKLTECEKKEILDRHNEIRQYVAAGKETRGNPGPQPRASFMPNLTWDNELAFFAQTWANQCPKYEDKCRDVARFMVGQNIAYNSVSYSRGTPFVTASIRDLVDVWHDHVQWFNSSNVHNYVETIKYAREYVRIVRARTRTVGCGRIMYSVNRNQSNFIYNHTLICNYGPDGHYENRGIYPTIL